MMPEPAGAEGGDDGVRARERRRGRRRSCSERNERERGDSWVMC